MPPELEGSPKPDNYVKYAWSPDGWLAAASWHDQSVRIWNSNGKLVATCLGHRGGVESVAWSPDGLRLASGGGDSVRVWGRDGNELAVMTGHADEVYGVAWSPDGERIASAGTDSTVRLWTPDGKPGPVLRGHQGGVFSVGWSPDAKKLVSSSWLDNTLRVWDIETEQTEWQALRLDPTTSITLSTSGQIIDGDPDAMESSLLYVVEQRDGTMSILTPGEFHARYADKLLQKFLDDKDKVAAAVMLDHVLRIVDSDRLDLPKPKLDVERWFQVGENFRGLRQLDKAALAYQRAVELDSEHGAEWNNLGSAWNNLGCALFAQGKDREALEAVRRAIGVDSENAMQWWNLGFVLNRLGQTDEANDAYREAITRDPNMASAQNGLAWNLCNSLDSLPDDRREAMRLATRATELDSGQGRYWNTLGVAQYRVGEFKAAIESLQRAKSLQHGLDAFDDFFLAMAHWELGGEHHEEANQWYGRAVAWMEANAPDNEELIRFRAEAEELFGIAPTAADPTELAAEEPPPPPASARRRDETNVP